MWRSTWNKLKSWRARHTRSAPGSRDGWVDVSRRNLHWRLRESAHIDRELIERGIFEPLTTNRLCEVIQPGMNVLDVGANFGYFTLILAKLVGEAGHVWAFEPTQWYRKRLEWHLDRNGLRDRVTVCPFGLSDRNESARVHIGDASATLHPMDDHPTGHEETIELRRLDDLHDDMNLDRIDFVKVDTDGHEPAFLRGAEKSLRQHRPAMVIEFFQGNLDQAGSDVREQKALLESFGYVLHSDRTGEPFASRGEFLKECGNFTHSVNVWAWPITDASRGRLDTDTTPIQSLRAVA